MHAKAKVKQCTPPVIACVTLCVFMHSYAYAQQRYMWRQRWCCCATTTYTILYVYKCCGSAVVLTTGTVVSTSSTVHVCVLTQACVYVITQKRNARSEALLTV
jgi:hypothetical protein